MSQGKIAHDRVERCIGERQVLNVCDAEFDAGMEFLRQLDHAGGEIDACRQDAELVCLGSKRPRAGSHIQKSGAGLNPCRVQQGSDRERRYRCKKIMVGRRQVIVPLTFKGTEAIGVLSGQGCVRVGHRQLPIADRTIVQWGILLNKAIPDGAANSAGGIVESGAPEGNEAGEGDQKC
jgi:hypothetical protein